MQTINGVDPTALRNTFVNTAGANVFTEEEKSADAEITHAAETIAFFVINPGLIMGNDSAQNVLLGDVNRDSVVNFADINAFIGVLIGGVYLLEADINQDGVVDFADISPFIDILIAQ